MKLNFARMRRKHPKVYYNFKTIQEINPGFAQLSGSFCRTITINKKTRLDHQSGFLEINQAPSLLEECR